MLEKKTIITIVDYGIGNLGSIQNMLKRIGCDSVVTSDGDIIRKAQLLILPGVGSFDQGMSSLNSSGVIAPLEHAVFKRKTPILGICLGMQLLTNGSEEGSQPGLGWIDAYAYKFPNENMKVPHMGWNVVNKNIDHPILAGLDIDSPFYFVHSYKVICTDNSNMLTHSFYGDEFSSGIIKNNIIGVQFHPEKSHKYGMQLLTNFKEMNNVEN